MLGPLNLTGLLGAASTSGSLGPLGAAPPVRENHATLPHPKPWAHALRQGDWPFLGDRARRLLGGTQPPPIAADQLSRGILAHCLKVMNEYRPRPVATRATLFRCRRHRTAYDRADLSSRKLLHPWDELILGSTETVWVDTDHAGIVLAPDAVAVVAGHLSSGASAA